MKVLEALAAAIAAEGIDHQNALAARQPDRPRGHARNASF